VAKRLDSMDAAVRLMSQFCGGGRAGGRAGGGRMRQNHAGRAAPATSNTPGTYARHAQQVVRERGGPARGAHALSHLQVNHLQAGVVPQALGKRSNALQVLKKGNSTRQPAAQAQFHAAAGGGQRQTLRRTAQTPVRWACGGGERWRGNHNTPTRTQTCG
jgi:hypothetical protein